MFEILSHMDIDSSFWHRKEGDPLTLGTGQKSLRLLADDLRDKLPALEFA